MAHGPSIAWNGMFPEKTIIARKKTRISNGADRSILLYVCLPVPTYLHEAIIFNGSFNSIRFSFIFQNHCILVLSLTHPPTHSRSVCLGIASHPRSIYLGIASHPRSVCLSVCLYIASSFVLYFQVCLSVCI